jgi:hypothetical protein
MYKSCTECPALEYKGKRPFCFWYQGVVEVDKPCGNHFLTKPDKTQEQMEEEAFGPMKPSDVIYAEFECDEVTAYIFVEERFFEENGHLDDSIADRMEAEEDILPEGFYRLEESSFEYAGSLPANEALEKAGFRRSAKLAEYLNNHGAS